MDEQNTNPQHSANPDPYHKPREEVRIFMFLDMKSSTAIAERLGHVRFYTLLNELFHEISRPVLQTKAEIYQYISAFV